MSVPRTLREAIAGGRLLPFVGAGVSMSVRRRDGGGPLFPSWRQLLEQAAERAEAEGKGGAANLVRAYLPLGSARFVEAAREARDALGPVWPRFLSERFARDLDDADPGSLALARAVWRLGSPVVVTTNYDRVLRWACPDQARLREWSVEAPAGLVELLSGALRSPTVWHLHGTIDRVDEIILTPDGYSTLYPSDPSAEVRHRAALTTLRTQLASRTLLFVGVSLDDDALGDQLRWVSAAFAGAAGPHYVLVRRAERERLLDRTRELGVEALDFDDFGAPLLERLDELGELASGGAAASSRFATPPAMPRPTPIADAGRPVRTTDPWTSAVRASALWSLTDGPVEDARAAVAELTAACHDASVSATAAATSRLGIEDPWRDDLCPVRTIDALPVFVAGQRLTVLETVLLLAAAPLRETLLRRALLRIAQVDILRFEPASQPSVARLELELQHRSHASLLTMADRSAHAPACRPAVACWLAHRCALASPSTWQDPRLEATARSAAARAVEAIRAVARPEELAQLLGSAPRGAPPSAFGLREQSVWTMEGLDVTVRERFVAHALLLAGHAALDARELGPAVIGTLESSDPLGPAELEASRRAASLQRVGSRVSVVGACDHPAFHAHVDGVVESMARVLARTTGRWAPAGWRASVPATVSNDLRALRREDGSPAYESPPLRLSIPRDRMDDVLHHAGSIKEALDVGIELYRNALSACRRAAAVRAQSAVVSGKASGDWDPRIEIERGHDARGPYVRCSDNGVGMDVDTFVDCFATAFSPHSAAPPFVSEHARWIATRLDLREDLVPSLTGEGTGVLRMLGAAREIEVASAPTTAEGEAGPSFRARLTSSGRVIRLWRSPGQRRPGTTVTVYLRGEPPWSSFAECMEAAIWHTPCSLTVTDGDARLEWAPSSFRPPSGRRTAASGARFAWVQGPGGVLVDGIAEVHREPFGVIINDRVANPAVDEETVLAACAPALALLDRSAIPTVSWLWALERAFPRVAETVAGHLAKEDRPLPLTRSIDGIRTVLSRHGVSSLDAWVLPADEADDADEGDRRETTTVDRFHEPDREPTADERLEALYPTWLGLPRVFMWASVSAVSMPSWSKPLLGRPAPPECPPVLPRDRIAFSERLDGRPPWIGRDVSVEHVVRAARKLGETVARSLARFRRMEPLGVCVRGRAPPALLEVRPEDTDVAILFEGWPLGWQLVKVCSMRGLTVREALAWLRARWPADVDPSGLDASRADTRFDATDAVLAEVVAARNKNVLSERVLGADLVRWAVRTGGGAPAVGDLAGRLGAVGLAVPDVDVERLRAGDVPTPAAMLEVVEAAGSDGEVTLLSFAPRPRPSTARQQDVESLVSGCRAYGLASLDARLVAEVQRCDADHLRLLSRDGDGVPPFRALPVPFWELLGQEAPDPAALASKVADLERMGLAVVGSAAAISVAMELGGQGALDVARLAAEHEISPAHVLSRSMATGRPLDDLLGVHEQRGGASLWAPAVRRIASSPQHRSYVATALDVAVAECGAGTGPPDRTRILALLADGEDAFCASLERLAGMGCPVPPVSRLALRCVAAEGRNDRPPSLRAIAQACCELKAPLGDGVIAVGRLFREDDRRVTGRWAAVRQVPSAEEVAPLRWLPLPLDFERGDAIQLPAVAVAALHDRASLRQTIGRLAWLREIGFVLPSPSDFTVQPEHLLLLSRDVDGAEPWLTGAVPAGHVLRVAHRLGVTAERAIELAQDLAGAGYLVPWARGPVGVVDDADLAIASAAGDGAPPWREGAVLPDDVAALSVRTGEPVDAIWRRLRRLSAVLDLALPDVDPLNESSEGASAPVPAAQARRGPVRLVIAGRDGVREVPIDKDVTVIGRSPACDVVIEDTGVSRAQCKLIRRRDGTFFLLDAGSTNGTRVDGRVVFSSPVTAATRISFAGFDIQVRTQA